MNRNEDPAEYLRQGYDLVNELTSPRAAAVNLLLSIVEKAGGGKKASRSGSSQSYLPKVLAHVESMLQTYEQAKASAASMPAREAAAAVTPYARKTPS